MTIAAILAGKGRDVIAIAPTATVMEAAAMLAEADRQAAALGAALITLSAQTYVVSLYEQAGYEVTSGTFDEVGIEHVRMEKRLP